MKVTNTIGNLIFHYEQDSDIVKQIKSKYEHKKRSCHYRGIRTKVDSLILEAAPGVVETIISDIGNIQNGTNFLNLGGGVGQLSSIFEYIGFDVTNTDINIENQDKKNIKVDFNNTDSLPLPENSFDIVLCQEVIEHIENPWRLLRMARRYIKEKGILYLTTPNIHSNRSKKCFVKTNHFIWFEKKDLSYHINPLPFWEIEIIAEKSDFKLLNIKGNGDYFFSRYNEDKNKVLKYNDILIYKLLAV